MNRISKLQILKQCGIATIDKIIHIENLGLILENGLFSHDNPYKKIDISNQEVNDRRAGLEPIYQKPIHEYVPFYFNPRNAMLYRNQKEFGKDIVILGFSTEIVCNDKVLFTDANAASDHSEFSDDITDLRLMNFSKVFSKSWHNNGVSNDDLKQTMLAEVLIEKHVDAKYIEIIYCQNNSIKEHIEKNYNIKNIKVIADLEYFFKV